jgi:hypothetical protein
MHTRRGRGLGLADAGEVSRSQKPEGERAEPGFSQLAGSPR